MSAKAQTLRTATLLAAVRQLELDATDDALVLLDQVTDVLLSQASRGHKNRRYQQLPELDRAARALRAAVLVLLDPPPGGIEELWNAIAAHIPRSELLLAVDAVDRLASRPDPQDGRDAAFREELLRRYQSLRRFLPREGRPGRVSATVSLKIVNGRRRRLVLSNPQLGDDEVARRAYSFCVLEALQGALNRRDVFVPRSGRFTDPRAKLLDGPAFWKSAAGPASPTRSPTSAKVARASRISTSASAPC